jgi:RNA polymerase sigma-70 factor (ECF subfamily)
MKSERPQEEIAPPPPDGSFAAVAARLQAGDPAAAAEIFRRFAHGLIVLARRHLDARLRAKVDPEDIQQSVLKSFFHRHALGEFDLHDWNSLWGLLTRITLRKCGHQLEAYLAQCRDVQRERRLLAVADSAASWQALARDPSPSEAAVLTEAVQLLLEGLRQRDREIVSLRLQGHSSDEICTLLHRPRRTVYRVLTRADEQLKRLLAE